MQKKGTITLFIIIGIILIVTIGFLSFFIGKSKEMTVDTTPKNIINKEVVNYAEQCLKETTLDGVFFNSLQGGYYYTPEPYIGDLSFAVPIYGKSGNYSVPSISIFNEELGYFIENNIGRCLKGFDSSNTGENISITGVLVSDVKINKKGYIDVALKLNISNNDRKDYSIKEISTRVNSDYHKYYELAVYFVEIQKQDPNVIMFSDMVGIAELSNMTITYFESPEDYRKIIFAVEDNNYKRANIGNYTYVFALEYDW